MSKITEQIKQFEKGLSSLKLEVDNSIVQSLLNLFEPIKAALENKVSDVSDGKEFSQWINEVIRFNEESVFGTGEDDAQVRLLKQVRDKYASIVNERKDNVGVSDAVDFAEYFRNNFDYYDCNANGRVYKWIDLSKRGQPAMPMIQIFNYWKSRTQLQQKEVDEEKELEERTDRNMNVISDFCEHLKNENIVIPEEVILSFFNA
jgi:hypothetical protein